MGTERNQQPNFKDTLENNDTVLVNNRGYEQSVDSAFFLSKLLTSVTIDGQTLTFTFADGHTTDVTLP